MQDNRFDNINIAIVIPYYNASNQICNVISKIPNYINSVIIINDKSKEKLPIDKIKSKINNKTELIIIENSKNLGVGGASKKGFQYALKHNFEIVIKVDSDDQMDQKFLPDLILPILNNEADMSKGNRFRDFKSMKKMPIIRRIGNLALSFLIKIATGYWNNFDPTNGFFAIKSKVIKELDFNNLSNRYYFETSLLAELYFQKARIKDVPMPPIYGNEKSNMNVFKMIFIFGRKLNITFIKRIIKSYFLYDFNIGSIYLLFGIPLFIFGYLFGIYHWYLSYKFGQLSHTGTIMIVTLSIILGFQLILQAIQFDIINAPKPEK